MKRIKRLTAILLTLTSACVISSCSLFSKFSKDSHTHAWKNYIIKTPTCTDTGLLEKLCEECGQKEYEEIAKSNHTLQNGICTVCGSSGQSATSITPTPMPSGANNTAAWSMYKIYETADSVANFEGTYENFLQQLSAGIVQDVYLDELGMLHVNISVKNIKGSLLEFPLSFIIGKVSPTNTQESELQNVYRVEVKNGEMLFTYSDGLQVSAGRVFNYNGGPIIEGFGINRNNELVVYYSDGKIAFAGKVLTGNAPENNATFMLKEVNGEYHIADLLDTSSDTVIIPTSHRGKAIVGISNNAFVSAASTIKNIVIPQTVTNYAPYAFYGLDFSKVCFFFEGNAPSNISSYNFYHVYEKGEWSYVNGVPTPNK